MNSFDLIDAAILKNLAGRGGGMMTYVVKNWLLSEKLPVTTAIVRRRLKKLESQGRVKRISSPYAVQICWSLP